MADITVINSRRVELNDGLLPEGGLILIAAGDDAANRFSAVIMQDGQPVALGAGDTVRGLFIRPDGVTVTIPGQTDGNTAYVTLPAACYYHAGHFVLSLQVNNTTVRRVEGTVAVTTSDTIAEEGAVYSLAELMTMINSKLTQPVNPGTVGQMLATDGNGGTYWTDPNTANVAGKLRVNSIDYTVRTGTSGASGYLTIVTG